MGYFASRNVIDALDDETRAMAHQSWGPFETVAEARTALAAQMREEADYLLEDGSRDWVIANWRVDRASSLRWAAAEIAADERREDVFTTWTEDGLPVARVDGLVWKVATHVW